MFFHKKFTDNQVLLSSLLESPYNQLTFSSLHSIFPSIISFELHTNLGRQVKFQTCDFRDEHM